MNTKNPPTWLASLFALVASSDPLSAQTAARAANDSVVELSPFVVSTTKDTGYQASSTLAGTRLDTPLKDLGASISIYTKDFMDDIGATSTNDFLIYATGMDAAGPGGNYSDTNPSNNIDATVPISNNVRENPQGSTRARGLGSPTFTRNFFIGGIGTDTYNVERMTVLRGPNAALFGVGAPAGIADTSLVKADLRRNKNKVTARLDNNYGLRTTVDFNRVLIPDKLAVRLAGLMGREEYNQRPAFEENQRIYGTFTYAPFKSTTLRGNFESGRMDANREVSALLPNGVSPNWLAAGRPAFDWAFYDDPARNPLAASQVSSNFYPYHMRQAQFQPITLFYNNPDDKKVSYSIRNVTPNTTANVADSVRQQLLHPLLNRDLAADTLAYTSTQEIGEFPAAQYWIGGNVLPGQLSGQTIPGLKNQGFTDFNAFDWKNRLIDETGRFHDSFRGFNLSLEQRGWDNRVGVELAYDRSRLYRGSYASFVSGSAANNKYIRVDTTATLPNGLPNPNLGRPYIQINTSLRWQNNLRDDSTARATGYVKYDFAEEGRSVGKWLGRHLLSGVIERYERDSVAFQNSYRAEGPYARTTNPVANNRNVSWVVYLGPSTIGNNNPLKFDSIKVGRLPQGPVGDIQYFSRPADATSLGAFTSGPLEMVLGNNGGSTSREVIESRAFTLQSNWLQDHVVTVLGWRRDEDYFADGSTNFVLNPTNQNDLGKVIWGFEDLDFPNTPPANVAKETKSFSVVVRWPQKLVKLPWGSDLSLFYNDSENFTPAGGRQYPDGTSASVPTGTTKEYGLNLATFNDKLTLRINRFETVGQNAQYNPPAYSAILNLPLLLISNWAVEGNRNPQLVASRNADIAKLTAVLPTGANYLTINNFSVTGTAPNLVVSRVAPPGLIDTTDFTATGTEFEVIYNPTPRWRILANVAHQKTVKSNSIPWSKKALAGMLPVLTELKDKPALSYPDAYQLGQPLPASVETLGAYLDRTVLIPLATEEATAGFPSAEQRNWRFNIVTNYQLGREPIIGELLKGWSVGGGLRWQGEMLLGFPSSRLANGTPVYDRANPWYAPSETNVDLFASYGRRIWDNRIDWKLQLNATNVYSSRDLVPVSVQPWGQLAAVRIAPQPRWYLTNTFSF